MSIQSEITRITGAKSDIADAIEAKGVTVPSATKLDGYAALVALIETEPDLQSKTVSPTETIQTISPDSDYDGLSSVTIRAIPSNYIGTGVTRKAAQTYTPGTTDQTISSEQYLTGAQTIKGDANLVAANIASGITIFGIVGTNEGLEPLTEEEIWNAATQGWGVNSVMTNSQIHTAVDNGWR